MSHFCQHANLLRTNIAPGELSARALTRSKGIHDAKNPYPAPITVARELFSDAADRNCIHAELNTENSGITYQHGDHVGVWPSNAEAEVERLLCALGLHEKKDAVLLEPGGPVPWYTALSGKCRGGECSYEKQVNRHSA